MSDDIPEMIGRETGASESARREDDDDVPVSPTIVRRTIVPIFIYMQI